MKVYRLCILFILCSAFFNRASAQDSKRVLATGNLFPAKKDTLIKKSLLAKKASLVKDSGTIALVKKDTVKKHDPRIATRRSAILPGWGQAYNKEYWKIPIVYGILAIPTVLYFYNDSYYKKTKFAYEARFKEANNDPSDVPFIDKDLKNLSISSLQSYRNSFRRDRDYSILYFLLAWGLQVADATVFAHLKDFDVSSDLSMQIKPSFNPQTLGAGLSLTLNLKNPSHKPAITR